MQRSSRMKPSSTATAPQTLFRTLAADQMPPYVSAPFSRGFDRADQNRPMSVGAPSAPLLGLPLARWIPQDCHSYFDYASGLVTAGTALATDDDAARLAGITLASIATGLSLVTDYRVSIAKLVPIEVHEAADYAWGALAIAAPFALGYWKSAPKVAITHVVAGVSTIVAALLTDYRAYTRRPS